jgi:hypothetical protein
MKPRPARRDDGARGPPERRWVRELTPADDHREKFRLYARHIRHVTEQWGN